MIQLIVLLPLLAAAIAGLGNKALGKLPAKIVTTGALFASCAMSWPIFISFLTGSAEAHVTPLFTWIQSGSFDAQWALRVDAMTAVMLVVITSGWAAACLAALSFSRAASSAVIALARALSLVMTAE